MKKHLWVALCALAFVTGCAALSSSSEDEDGRYDNVRAEADEKEKIEKEKEARKPAAKTPTALPEGMLRKKVLVLKFMNRSLFGGEELGQYTAWDVGEEVSKQSDLTVVFPEDISPGESLYSSFGDYNWKLIFEKAKANGISGIITGNVEDLLIEEKGDEVGVFRTRYNTVAATVKIQMWDVASEKSIYSKVGSAEVTEESMRLLGGKTAETYDARRARGAVQKALEATFAQLSVLAKRIAWVGRIAKIDLHRYYINAGSSTGLSKGQLLKVFGEGSTVVDHESNAVLGVAPGRFKGTLKIVDYFGTEGTVAVVHSGAGFRERDRVEIYTP